MKTEHSHQIFTADEFRLFLRQELISRTAKNPKYSLRSFARQLGVSAPVLSHWLGGRRRFTPGAVQKIGFALGLGPEKINEYISNLNSNLPDRPVQPPFNVLLMDVFEAMAEWYHDAILELTHIPTLYGRFKMDCENPWDYHSRSQLGRRETSTLKNA